MQSDKCDLLSPSLNFQVFYRSFSRQKIGAILASLLQFINFLQIFCFIFSALFRDQPLTSTGIDYLMDFASYFEMITYLDLNQTLYSAMRFLASFLNLVYLVLFVSMRYLIKQNTTVNSVEQLFSRCNMTYVRIFMLATCEIMFREVFCDQTVLSAYSEECFKGVHIPIFILSMTGIMAALTMAVLTAFYSLTGIYDKHTYFSGENRLFDILITFTKILLPLLVAAGEEDSNTFRYVYVGINEVLSLSLLWCFFTYYPYNRTLIEYFTLGYLILYWAQSTSMVIFMAAQEESVNTDLVYFLLTITSVPAIIFVYITKKRRLIVRGNITSPKLLLRQIQITLQLKQNEKLASLDEIYFRGLITKHRASCHNFRCFCKADELYAPTKNKSFERAKWPTLKPLVLKYYVRTVFEEAIERGTSDSDLLISYAEFLFQKFRNCHLALHQVAKLLNLNKFLYPYQRFRIFKLRQKISAYINLRNLEALETPLEVENVVFVEEQLEKVIAGMRQIISTSIGFWGYLYGKEVDLNSLKTLAEEMSGAVEETIRLWVPLKPYLYKQKRIMYYYNWFLKDFLQEKIILSEDEVDSLFDNDTDSVYSNEFLGTLKEDNIIFQEDTAVIHMSGNSTDLGNIIKTNQGAMKLFGYRKEQMEKHNIDMLMPKLIARKHNYYLNTYVTTGKSQVLYDQMKTFAKSRNGYVMPVWIVIKQINNIDGLIQYAGLIQPLSQKKDEYNHYILLNNYGEISGISKNLAEFFNIPGNIFEKSDVNVIMLAPKLIKYFFFAKVLQSELASSMTSQHMLGTLFTMSPGLKRRGATKLTDKITSIMGGLTKKNPLQEFLDLDTLQREDTLMHNENEEDHGSILSEDIPGEKSNEINIEFTMRLPKKLKRFIKEFNRQKSRHNELLNNQQVLFEAIHSKTLEKAVSGDKSLHTPESPTLKGRTTQDLLMQSQTLGRSSGLITSPKTKKKTLGHLANFKHAIDSYVGALRMTASKIARTGLNNVYRIKGVLVTDYYGPDKDIVKYIKILEITKKAERFTHLSALTPANRISGSNDVARWSRSSTISQQGASRPGRKALKTSTFKTERLNEEDQAKNPYEDSSGPSASRSGLSEDGSPSRRKSPHGSRSKSRDLSSESSRSRSLRNQDSFNSQKSEFQLDEEVSQPSQADSDKKAIMNELKTNIMTHTASIYHKEDNLMIDKNFPSLRNVKWFIRVLFLSLVPLNLIIYLVGPYDTFRQLENSVSDIYANENLRRHYIRSHDTIMTLILDNSGFFDSLRPEYDTQLDSMVTDQMSYLNTQYRDIYQESSKDEWTTIVYNYATRSQKETTLNYQGSFEGSVTDIQNAIQTLTNSLFQIQSYPLAQFTGYDEELSFYRINCLEKFNKILGDATNIIFESLDQGFGNSENLSITILLSEGLMFTVSFFIILRLILIVITSLREVLIIFTVIDPQQIIETEMYYRRLLEYMEVSNRQYFGTNYIIQHAIPAKEAIKAKSFKPYDDSKQKLQKKMKKINYGRFMRADSIKILSYYVLSILLCFSLSLLFHFESKTTIDYIQDVLTDSQRFIQLSPVYITSLVGLKELTFNKTNYQQFDLPCLQDTINVLDQTLSRTGFSSDISFVDYFKSILDGTPCEAFKDVIANSDDLINCLTLSDGRLSTGLITFHNYYKGEVVDILTLNADEHFGVVGPLEIYEYSELIKIIDNVFMDQALITWKSAIETYLKSKENFLIILIVVVSILNVGVYFVAKTGVVGILKNRFSFYKKIYNKYMLGEAPVKEKRIKAVLVKYKLLHK